MSNLIRLQEQFITNFLSDDKSRHILVAPPGSGKTYVSIHIINKLNEAEGKQSVLWLVSSKALVAFLEHNLLKQSPELKIVAFDRHKFSKLDQEKAENSEFWEPGNIYVTDSQVINSHRFYKRALSFRWDLVIVESNNSTDADKLIEKITTKRLLYLANDLSSTKSKNKFFEKFKLTNWQLSQILEPKSDNPYFVINFNLSEEEKDVYARISLFLKGLLKPIFQQEGRFELNLNSTIYSAEQLLLKIRNHIAHNAEGKMLINNEEYEIIYNKENISEIEKLIQDLSSITQDSKISAVLDLVNKIKTDKSFPCIIFTRYISNIKYLMSILREEQFKVNVLYSQLNPDQIRDELDSFNKDGQILIASDSILRGIDLKCNSIVHFDLPVKAEQLYYRQTRVRKFENIIKTYFMIDSNKENELNTLIKDSFLN